MYPTFKLFSHQLAIQLTPGPDLIDNLHWQPVPGDDHAEVFPHIRKVNTNSSNSYIISTPFQIILIDPGGYAGQIDVLATEIERIRTAHPRPVFIYLTHTHFDHFVVMQSHTFFKGHVRAIIATHVTGGANLERADTALTQADMFQIRLNPMHVPIQFFSSNPGQEAELFEIYPLQAPGVCIRASDITIDDHLILKRQIVVFGTNNRIIVYHLPGHSHYSIGIQVRGLLSLATCYLQQVRELPVFMGGASRISSNHFVKSTGSWKTKGSRFDALGTVDR